MKTNKYLTVITLITFLAIVYLFTSIKLLIIIGVCLGLISIVSGKVAYYIHYLWFKIAEGIGFVMSKVILSIVFFVVLCPVALLSRLFDNKSNIITKRQADSYYFTRNHEFEAKDME